MAILLVIAFASTLICNWISPKKQSQLLLVHCLVSCLLLLLSLLRFSAPTLLLSVPFFNTLCLFVFFRSFAFWNANVQIGVGVWMAVENFHKAHKFHSLPFSLQLKVSQSTNYRWNFFDSVSLFGVHFIIFIRRFLYW